MIWSTSLTRLEKKNVWQLSYPHKHQACNCHSLCCLETPPPRQSWRKCNQQMNRVRPCMACSLKCYTITPLHGNEMLLKLYKNKHRTCLYDLHSPFFLWHSVKCAHFEGKINISVLKMISGHFIKGNDITYFFWEMLANFFFKYSIEK